jgi:transcription antitermination factor NusG
MTQPGLPDAAGEYAWCVLHVRPRCEKKVEQACRWKKIRIYLPLLPRRHRYGNRSRVNLVPLFPGYVFAYTTREERAWLKQNDYVANLLETSRQEELVAQIRTLEASLAVGQVVEVLPFLQEGQRIVIRSGPFKGVEGIIARVKNRDRVMIRIELIQQTVVFEADTTNVRPET